MTPRTRLSGWHIRAIVGIAGGRPHPTRRWSGRRDADAFLAMQRQLDRETDFMLMAPGERQTTIEQQRDIIHKILSDGRSMTWVVVDGQRLVGALTLRAMAPLKIRHTGHLVVGILAAHQGRGVGSELFRHMEAWALAHEFHRLVRIPTKLTTDSSNV